ncbi:hypothetical protein PInf_017873 [Phytophthora infestans]|nr:hypothetical protein PInf_017873 [Phytophthora infestans]
MAREKTTAPATAATLRLAGGGGIPEKDRRGDKGDRGDGTRNDVGKLGTGDEGHDGGREVHSDDVEKGGTGDEVEKGGTDVLVSGGGAARDASDDLGKGGPGDVGNGSPEVGQSKHGGGGSGCAGNVNTKGGRREKFKRESEEAVGGRVKKRKQLRPYSPYEPGQSLLLMLRLKKKMVEETSEEEKEKKIDFFSDDEDLPHHFLFEDEKPPRERASKTKGERDGLAAAHASVYNHLPLVTRKSYASLYMLTMTTAF